MAKVELDIRAQITNLNKGLDKTEKQLKELQTQSNKTSKTIQKNMGGTTNSVNKLKGALAGVLTIGAAVQFTKAIINVRKEFETFRAVLTNTLGSAEAANKEFAKIQQFAAETPFSVRELTDSFVRLVNQGFKPTTKELKQLGDLAAAVGKDFIQLTEAIIDAQVGEFERLKEFGIRAQKEGDKVTFTFKEQQTQVEFTSKAIQEYVLSLGDVEGVSGAMAAISETLQGKISNLGDSWEGLLDTIGGRTSGVFTSAIRFLSTTIEKINELLEITDPVKLGLSRGQGILRSLIIGDEGELDLETLNKEIGFFNDELLRVDEEIRILKKEGGIFESIFGSEEKEKELAELNAELKETQITLEILNEALKESGGGGGDVVQIEILKDLGDKLKQAQKDRLELNTADIEGIAIKNREIKALKDQIEELGKLGVALDVKTPKIDELVIGGDDDIFEIEKDLLKERTEEYEKTNRDIEFIEKQRIRNVLAAESMAAEQENLLLDGRIAALTAGLDLIGAANKDNAEIQQAVSIAQAIINGAVGITKTGAELGFPAAIPFQIALGLQTLAQIALISQQKFERGGYDVLRGRRHAQGGIPIGIGQEAEDGEGRAIFTRAATKKHGKFLPAFVKAINEGKTQVTDSGSYSFNYDDSRSVGKLEDIRKLLAKAEVSYENGFRIETRNGQRTRVKI